ncbi:uncharacterized protein LOC123311864 [Coccinella septempunctata]|uniref:uncharacterized protein LOC123311864 n=1 Tax=Coccinella septempunctata TaxID=41139 RepID=UPI001D067061|nr:uncharacterized protein LOC123311864 [Coccinella septempunctata]
MTDKQFKKEFIKITKKYIAYGIPIEDLQKTLKKPKRFNNTTLFCSIIVLVLAILHGSNVLNFFAYIFIHLRGVRCLVPNNYFVWEATRQVSDCSFCLNVSEPIILRNVSKEEFAPYAYTSKPVIIRNAFSHWPAMKEFDFEFFKKLYHENEDAYKSVDEECQFLHFKSDFTSLRDVFLMDHNRVVNEPGQRSWYVGWGNCHPEILTEMRKYYPKPHFLPDDCEMPSKEYVFMGYGAGATMHLDYINRLMWQAQLKGSKTWNIRPAPECEEICSSMSFIVKPGDAILLDTRVWYHGTTVNPGQFSLSIQSEYG